MVLLVTYDSVKLSGDASENTELNRVLLDNNVKPQYAEKILADLKNGVTVRNHECKERELSNCVLVPTGEDYALVLDYDNKRLLLFVSPNLVNQIQSKIDRKYQQTKKITQ
ncbi:hypothetical protein QYZ45_26080 [Vibrio parahaemolyticus]|nr:hypothetical protein [Vibrio parahaemolyticus]